MEAIKEKYLFAISEKGKIVCISQWYRKRLFQGEKLASSLRVGGRVVTMTFFHSGPQLAAQPVGVDARSLTNCNINKSHKIYDTVTFVLFCCLMHLLGITPKGNFLWQKRCVVPKIICNHKADLVKVDRKLFKKKGIAIARLTLKKLP